MRSSELRRGWSWFVAGCILCAGSSARAQDRYSGFNAERYLPAAPGAGWLVNDDLGFHGKFAGGFSLISGYSRSAFRLDAPSTRVVENDVFATIAAALSYERVRLSAFINAPILVTGHGARVGTTDVPAPGFNVAQNPDTLADSRFALDVRLLGAPDARFRLGAGAQLIVPSGHASNYVSDGTYRGIFKLMAAGDVGRFTYAAQAGFHLRTHDDPLPSTPRGSELQLAVAAGIRLRAGSRYSVVIGPELFGQTAFRAFFAGDRTGVEALLSGRLEGPEVAHVRLRFKLGTGGGLHPDFGAPQWRIAGAVELLATP